MKTDAYLDVVHHATIEEFIDAAAGRTIVAVDNVEGSQSLHDVKLPRDAVLVFGGEGPGVSRKMLERADMIVAIEQFGSTRSINVGVASGILMYKWVERHILLKK
jgi:tRNA G18 (ribose-2'-O)-methylase SpoU